MKRIFAAGLVAALTLTGCESKPVPQSGAPPTPIVTPMQGATGVVLDGENFGGCTAPTASAPAAAPAQPPATEQVKATAGVGIKGQSLQEHSGILVEPAKQFFRFEQKAVFDIQIPQALQLFEASEGHKPKSEEEFMSRVVAANNINLPKLPDGHKYIYDVESGELRVERPAK